MKQSLFFIMISLILMSCNTTPPPSTQPTKEFTFKQLDSIGKAYTPQIGHYGGTVNLAIAADPDGFCPALTNSGYSMQVLGFVFEGLITTDPATLAFKPHVAKSWSVSEDGLTWIFKLRDDVYFTDSVQLTSADVLFTFNDIIYNKKLNSPLDQNFRVDGEKILVTALDSLTVQFTLPKPFAPFLSIVGVALMPKHIYEKYALEDRKSVV